MVVKLDDDNRITSADVAATRIANQTQPSPAPATTSQGTIIGVVPGEQGRADAVVYPVAQEDRFPGGPSIYVPDPAGHLDAQGNPVPGSRNVAPTTAEQKIITGYVQQHGTPANINRNKLTNPLPKEPVFNPSGNKVRIDNLPRGTDFEATRKRLLELPDGTQVQIGDSSNEDVYAYKGGLVNSRGEYYTGYGGVTDSMAEEARRRPVENDPYSQSFKKQFPNLMGPGSEIRSQPAYTPTVEDLKNFGKPNDDTVYIQGVPLDQVLSKLSRVSSNLNMQLGKSTEDFALKLGPAGSSRNEIGTFLGWTAGIPTGMFQFGVDLFAMDELLRRNPQAGYKQIQANLDNNIPAFQQSAAEHPGAFWTSMALGAYLGMKAPIAGGKSFKAPNIGADIADSVPKVKTGSKPGSSNLNAGSTKTQYGYRFTGEKPNTKFDTSYIKELKESPGKAGGRGRAAAYDSGEKISNVFESPGGEAYADLVNEAAGGEAIAVDPWKSLADKGNAAMRNIKIEPASSPATKTIEINKKLVYTQSDRPVFRPYKDTDMNWAKAQENIKISVGKSEKQFGFKDNMKEFFGNDKGSAQLLEPLERLRTKPRTVDDMVYNPASSRMAATPKTRLKFNGSALLVGSGVSSGYMTSMITGSKTRQAPKPRQIIGPGPNQKINIPDISLTNLISGTGQKTRPYTGGYQPPKTNQGTSTALAFAFGAGVAGMSMSKLLSPGKLRGMGGDSGGYRKLLGTGMKREKYLTGDITGLLFGGKKKRKTKRR